ncbi:hypothetical protein COLO4_29132 [Corchorus olitorius]|uniref:Uncharacterized protein n=1 Tax=Corchorus olitorius TaxID=93759 RepID=A0A1R3HG91_9ROSI|nr:hypothetical protein COLO4_29132 [Corchorus olitorius]
MAKKQKKENEENCSNRHDLVTCRSKNLLHIDYGILNFEEKNHIAATLRRTS